MKKIASFLFIVHCLLSGAQTIDGQGRKQGYWKKTDDKGKLVYEGMFKDDVPVGKFKHYYPNDSVRAIMYFKNDGKSAYVRLFHMSGKRMGEGRYVGKEIKDSTWTYYDELGVLISRENYKAGKKDGVFTVYLPDGTFSEQRHYKDDLQHGSFKEYFTGNRVKGQGNYVNGKLEGRVTYYYPNGAEVATGFYKNGEKNGPWMYKTESGKVREKELYKNGALAPPKETEAFFSKTKTEAKEPVKPGQKNKTAGPGPVPGPSK